MDTLYDVNVVILRKDLREKYGLQPLKNMDDLKVYLEKVKENEKSMIPLGLHRGFQTMFALEDKQTNFRTVPYVVSGTGTSFDIVLSQDNKKVLAAVALGDPSSVYENLPAPYNKGVDYFHTRLGRFAEFSKFLEKDVLVQKDSAGLFKTGKAAAIEGTVGGITKTFVAQVKAGVPQAEIEFFAPNSKMQQQQAGAIGTTYKANNSLVIPATSKNVDRTMKFLDWIFSSQENHDLLELGIEGEHWSKDGEKGYKLLNTNYAFQSYELTSNLTLSRINADYTSEALAMKNYALKADSYYELPLSRFSFNTEPVKTEIAKLGTKANEFMPVINYGLDPNWRESLSKMNKELRDLGLEKVRAEVIKQVQAYLDAGGK
jgi:ABC-type glycerol-3-phosphate transport system substrate-binding protein